MQRLHRTNLDVALAENDHRICAWVLGVGFLGFLKLGLCTFDMLNICLERTERKNYLSYG